MRQLDATNVCQYLVETGRAPPRLPLRAVRLAGGVSNEVLLVEAISAAEPRFVVKQARPQLRTPQDWFCTIERIWREVEVLKICAGLAAPGQVPNVLFEDRENYLYAMSAAVRGHSVWRDDLLAGRFDSSVAATSGRLLASLHAGTWRDPAIEQALADRDIFRQLRIEPYYETVAQAHPGDAPLLSRLIDSVWTNRCALVHADFSPKNLLVAFNQGAAGAGQSSAIGAPPMTQLMLVDYETGHYGDPAFDLGFFLAHLVLKAFYHAPDYEPMLAMIGQFWAGYRPLLEAQLDPDEYGSLMVRAIENLAGCLWARIDGKSRVDYLTEESRRSAVRHLARAMLIDPPGSWPEALAQIQFSLARLATA